MNGGSSETAGSTIINIVAMKTFKSFITETPKQKLSVGRKKKSLPADYEQATRDQVQPSGASYSNTFIEDRRMTISTK